MEKASLLLDTDQQDGTLNFPHKLHLLLDQNNYPQLIKWKEHGCCFEILDQTQLTKVVLAPIFKQSKWGSFQRQLHVYGFKKLSKGDDKGCFFHPHFLRGREDLLRKMKRFSLLKDLLMNVDHYYYTKFLPHAITRPSPSSVTAMAAMSRANSSAYNLNRPPLPPSPNHGVRFQQRPYEATTNPMMIKQDAVTTPSPHHLPQQQNIPSPPGTSLPNPANSSGVASSPRFILSVDQGSAFPAGPMPPPATGFTPPPLPPSYHLDSNGRPISYNSYFLKANPEYHQKMLNQQLPPLPPLHQSFLPRSTSAFILSSSSLQSEYMEEHGYSHHSGSMSGGGGGGGSLSMNGSRGSFEHSQDRAYSISETSSVTPSMITESDSYYTNEHSFSASADMYDSYYRDPYRLQYSHHPPPPFIGMMIGGGGSSSRADDDEVDELDDEATIDRYIVEYFKEDGDDPNNNMEGGIAGGSTGEDMRGISNHGSIDDSLDSQKVYVSHHHNPHSHHRGSFRGYDDCTTAMETMEGSNISYYSQHSHSTMNLMGAVGGGGGGTATGLSSATTTPTPPLSLPPSSVVMLNASQRPSITSSISSSGHPNSPSATSLAVPGGGGKGFHFPRQFLGNGSNSGQQHFNHSPTSSALLPPSDSSPHFMNQLSSQGLLPPPLPSFESYPPNCSIDAMEI